MLDCPRCQQIRAGLADKTPVWCSKCGRWQFVYQPALATLLGATYRHYACVACHDGALCRDMWIRPNAVACARECHVEAFDKHVVVERSKAPTR